MQTVLLSMFQEPFRRTRIWVIGAAVWMVAGGPGAMMTRTDRTAARRPESSSTSSMTGLSEMQGRGTLGCPDRPDRGLQRFAVGVPSLRAVEYRAGWGEAQAL
jgi:hypothetical protein